MSFLTMTGTCADAIRQSRGWWYCTVYPSQYSVLNLQQQSDRKITVNRAEVFPYIILCSAKIRKPSRSWIRKEYRNRRYHYFPSADLKRRTPNQTKPSDPTTMRIIQRCAPLLFLYASLQPALSQEVGLLVEEEVSDDIEWLNLTFPENAGFSLRGLKQNTNKNNNRPAGGTGAGDCPCGNCPDLTQLGLMEMKPCVPWSTISEPLRNNAWGEKTCATNTCPNGCCRAYSWLKCDEGNVS